MYCRTSNPQRFPTKLGISYQSFLSSKVSCYTVRDVISRASNFTHLSVFFVCVLRKNTEKNSAPGGMASITKKGEDARKIWIC